MTSRSQRLMLYGRVAAMLHHTNLIEILPRPAELHDRLSRALREVDLCRRLLRVAERAEQFRNADADRETSLDTDGQGKGGRRKPTS